MFCFTLGEVSNFHFAVRQAVMRERSALGTSWQTLCGQQIEHALYCIVMKYFTWNEYPDNKSGSVKKKWKAFIHVFVWVL